MNKTKIEWCDSTWNPVTGCNHGCEYCYARRIATRFGGASHTTNNECGCECQWMTEDDGRLHDLNAYIYDEDRHQKAPYPFGFSPTMHRYRLGEPARWKKPRTIFVCSMADLFGAWVPDKWIADVFAACKAAPQHRYLFLTKNPQRYLALAASETGLPLDTNMWYGSTVTAQDENAFVSGWHNTFLSVEPLLAPMRRETLDALGAWNWVIIGAETGNRKGKIVPERKWVDEIVAKCDLRGIPVFMKESLAPIVGEENMRREFPWTEKEDNNGND